MYDAGVKNVAMAQTKLTRCPLYKPSVSAIVLVLIWGCVGFLLIFHQEMSSQNSTAPPSSMIHSGIRQSSGYTGNHSSSKANLKLRTSFSGVTERYANGVEDIVDKVKSHHNPATKAAGAGILMSLHRIQAHTQAVRESQPKVVGVTIFAREKLGLIKEFRKKSADPPLPVVIVCDGSTDTEPTRQEVKKYLHTEVTIIGEHSLITEFANVYLLTFRSQSLLFPRLHRTLPETSRTRKVMGYLLAYSLGAIAIWDFDAEATLTPTEGFLSAANINRLKTVRNFTIASHTTVTANPIILMGATLPNSDRVFSETLWPRGTPLTDVTNDEIPTIYETRKLEETASIFKSFRTGIVQSIINGSTDSSPSHIQGYRVNVDFLSRLESVVIHPAQFAPATSMATLFYIEVLWSMYLPTAVPQEVADVWRGYIAQALMRCSGYLLVYTKPQVSRSQMSEQNRHGEPTELHTSKIWQHRTELLIRFLQSFRCNFESSGHCLVQVYEQLSDKGIMMSEDVTGVKAWVESLKQAKYVFTAFKEKYCSKHKSNAHHGIFRIAKPVKPHFRDITNVPSNDTLLVIHINYRHTEVIPLWKAVWQHVYPHPTVFYSPDTAQCRSFAARNVHCISDDYRGYYSYESLLDAVQRYPGYNSYVSAHDDLVMNPRLFGMAVANQASMITDRGHSELYIGKNEIKYFPRDNYTLEGLGENLKRGLREIRDNGDLEKLLPLLNRHCPGEQAYYVPFKPAAYDGFVVNQKDVEAFVASVTILRNHEIFLEAAVPWAMHCVLGAGIGSETKLSLWWLGRVFGVTDFATIQRHVCKEFRIAGATSWSEVAHPAKLMAGDEYILGVIRFRNCMQDFLV